MSEKPDLQPINEGGSPTEVTPASEPVGGTETGSGSDIGAEAGGREPGPAPAADSAPAAVSSRARLWALAGAGVAVLVVLLALAINVLGIGKGGGEATDAAVPTSSPSPLFGPQQVDAAALASQAADLGHPIYWAGKPGDRTLELTVAADNGTLVRYLEPKGGTGPGDALTVAMYPVADPYAAAKSAATAEGAMSQTVDGALIVGNTANPYNGYLAREDLGLLVEVFDPQPGEAWQLLSEGKIVAVPAPQS